MSVTLSSLPGKFKCSLLNVFCPEGISPNSGLTRPNNIYIYIYIYIERERERERTVCLWMTIYAPPWGLSSLVNELTATVSVMQGSSKELSSLVSR